MLLTKTLLLVILVLSNNTANFEPFSTRSNSQVLPLYGKLTCRVMRSFVDSVIFLSASISDSSLRTFITSAPPTLPSSRVTTYMATPTDVLALTGPIKEEGSVAVVSEWQLLQPSRESLSDGRRHNRGPEEEGQDGHHHYYHKAHTHT